MYPNGQYFIFVVFLRLVLSTDNCTAYRWVGILTSAGICANSCLLLTTLYHIGGMPGNNVCFAVHAVLTTLVPMNL